MTKRKKNYLGAVLELKILSSSLSSSFKASMAFCFAMRKVLELVEAVLFLLFFLLKNCKEFTI